MNPVPNAHPARLARRAVLLAIVALAALLALAPRAHAQAGSVVRTAAKEAMEALGRSAGRDGAETLARELARFGGEAAVRETIERAAKEAGEYGALRVAALAERHGLDALRAVRNTSKGSLAPVVAALDQTAPDLLGPALRSLAREGEGPALAELAVRFGPGALETAARHPGVGTTLVQRLGSEGVDLGARLTTDQSLAVARHADGLASLAPAERAGVVRLILDQPAKAAAFLDKHPRFFLIGGAGAVLLANADALLNGTAEVVIGPDGKPALVAQAGLLERAILRPILQWLLPVLAAVVALWGAVKIAGAAMRERAKSTPRTAA